MDKRSNRRRWLAINAALWLRENEQKLIESGCGDVAVIVSLVLNRAGFDAEPVIAEFEDEYGETFLHAWVKSEGDDLDPTLFARHGIPIVRNELPEQDALIGIGTVCLLKDSDIERIAHRILQSLTRP